MFGYFDTIVHVHACFKASTTPKCARAHSAIHIITQITAAANVANVADTVTVGLAGLTLAATLTLNLWKKASLLIEIGEKWLYNNLTENDGLAEFVALATLQMQTYS